MSEMSKRTGKRTTAQKNSNRNHGDVTLNDFANSPVSKGQGRLKKSATKSFNIDLVQEVKQLSMAESDDRAWDEKLEEFDGDFEFVEEDGEDGSTSVVIKRPAPRCKKTLSEDEDSSATTGMDYPLDIWFLISEHIPPEDVGTFSSICKSALYVTNTAKFWFRLYKRHYKSVPNLPERLQPECMMRLYGLQANVVRALHFMYPPFVNKIKTVTTFEGDPHGLTKRQCVLMWHQRCKNNWLFFFKLKSSNICFGHRPSPKPRQPDLIEMLEDVSANQDEGCKVLQVTCLNYISLPVVLGMSLCSVSLNLSQGLRYHRLQLGFGAGHMCYTVGKQVTDNNGMLVLDPVANVRVLDWWHPLYPHTTSTGFNIHIQDSE